MVPCTVRGVAAAVFWGETAQVLQTQGTNTGGCCALCGTCALACFEGEVMDYPLQSRLVFSVFPLSLLVNTIQFKTGKH